jgi:two-component system sensor histidine kinase BaeS
MMRSLRFRLPALFLAGIVIAGFVSVAIAFQLLQSYSRSQSLKELRKEASGLNRLISQQAKDVIETRASAPAVEPKQLESATGDRIYYFGVPPFPGESSGLRTLPAEALKKFDPALIRAGHTQSFDFTPRHDRALVAVAGPLTAGGTTLGVLVIAKPQTELRDTWVTLMKFFGISILGGLVVAGILSWYASRRITQPLLGLSSAADEIAQGNYNVPVPQVQSKDEIGHLAERFREMAARLAETEERERNFLMTVSHELRTPLTAIRGHVEAMREGLTTDPADQAASLEVVATAAARLERLVGDVLDLAKLDTHRFTVLHEEVDMGRVLDQAYAAYGEEARRRSIDYRCDIEERPVIVTDGDRVLQIISNLLTNAFRWTPDGGRVDLGLTARNGNVSVLVSDTGPGIKPEERERIFRPFFSHDHSREGGGTGLGLAIARELALALGGRLELDTTPGQGSRFRLVLPTTAAV